MSSEEANKPGDSTVQVEQLIKVYPGDVKAVNGIDFAAANGEFFGLHSPNGAGKSTTMKIMATLLRKTSGKVVVAGNDVDQNQMEIRRSIGFAMQEVGLDDLAKGRDFLITQGLLYDLPHKTSKARAEDAVGVGRFDRGGQSEDRNVLGRHASAPRPEQRPHAQLATALPRRADHGPRPAEPLCHLGPPRAAQPQRHNRHPHNTNHGGGEPALPTPGHH
ncbi:MAG: ATP-binding cassette domain-containing protein [SAR202 cluster bacterium]|nr:ATP-binding cassette domain-containing protein [SAR202 cluster bacterium]